MTYRIVLITQNEAGQTSIDLEGVSMPQMKSTIQRLIAKYGIPSTATLHVEQENPRKVYFRGILSSIPSLVCQ